MRLDVLVLKPLYVPEELRVAAQLPMTLEELFLSIQGARSLLYALPFPCLVAAAPQSVAGRCVVIANPEWLGHDAPVCVNLLAVDGRLFATGMPTYVDRRDILRAVGLPVDLGVHIFVGFDDLPLRPDTRTHLFPGVTVLILPEDTPALELAAILDMPVGLKEDNMVRNFGSEPTILC